MDQKWECLDGLAIIKVDGKWVLPDKLRKYTVTKSGCWEFQNKSRNPFYRPTLKINGKVMCTARWIMWTIHGPLTREQFALHHCDNTRCINPDHLYVGDHADNMRDKVQRGRCRLEHDLTKENLAKIKLDKDFFDSVELRYYLAKMNLIFSLSTISRMRSKSYVGATKPIPFRVISNKIHYRKADVDKWLEAL